MTSICLFIDIVLDAGTRKERVQHTKNGLRLSTGHTH